MAKVHKVKEKMYLSDVILFLLEKSIRGGELVLETSQEMRNWIYDGVWDMYPRQVEKGTISRVIKRLRERRLIEQENKETGEIVLKLTQAGKEFIFLKRDIDDNSWDGKWRIVIFDIPESKRLIRNVLRRKLKSWGFQKWQKSVWASKKDLTLQLRKLIKELRIDDWVLVIESDNV